MYRSPIAAALSGATERQLSYWRQSRGDTEPLLVPEYGDERAWYYSFRDVVALRAFVATRQQVSLQRLRKAVQQMDPTHHPSEYRILGYGNDVVVAGPGEPYVDSRSNLVFDTVVEDLFEEFRCRDRLVRHLQRPYPEVRVDPGVRNGYPCIQGTRVPFHLVADLLVDGVEPEEVAGFYPSVTAAAARDALRFAEYVETSRHGRSTAA